MARDGIDLSELDEFTDRLIQSSKEADKAQRKFLRQQGSKLARKTRAKARAKVNKTKVVRKKYTREAGQYHKSIKRGKLVVRGNDRHIRVYSNDKIGHLIEDGWTCGYVALLAEGVDRNRVANTFLRRLGKNLSRNTSAPARRRSTR